MKHVFSETVFSSLELLHLHSPTLTITSVGTTHHLAYPRLMDVVFGILFELVSLLNRNFVAFLSKLVTGDTYLHSY